MAPARITATSHAVAPAKHLHGTAVGQSPPSPRDPPGRRGRGGRGGRLEDLQYLESRSVAPEGHEDVRQSHLGPLKTRWNRCGEMPGAGARNRRARPVQNERIEPLKRISVRHVELVTG